MFRIGLRTHTHTGTGMGYGAGTAYVSHIQEVKQAATIGALEKFGYRDVYLFDPLVQITCSQ